MSGDRQVTPDSKGTTTVKKDYQTRAAAAAQPDLALPDSVAVAMADLAETLREGLLALAVGTGCR